MTTLARDLMKTSLVTVGPTTPLAEVSRLFVAEAIHGAPVVDEDSSLLGVISTSDLLRVIEQEHDSPANDPMYFRDVLEFSGPDWSSAPADFQDRLSQLTVSDAMQSEVITVTEATPITDVAKILRSNQIHRVLVVREGWLVGVLTAFDLMALLESEEPG